MLGINRILAGLAARKTSAASLRHDYVAARTRRGGGYTRRRHAAPQEPTRSEDIRARPRSVSLGRVAIVLEHGHDERDDEKGGCMRNGRVFWQGLAAHPRHGLSAGRSQECRFASNGAE